MSFIDKINDKFYRMIDELYSHILYSILFILILLYFLPLIIWIILVIFLFFFNFNSILNIFKRPYNTLDSGIIYSEYKRQTKPTLTKEQYEIQKKYYTNKELKKLAKNPVFKRMLTERGMSKENWVWQTKEKKKTFFPQNDITDEE